MAAADRAQAMLGALSAVDAVKPGLERIRILLAAIGDPQEVVPVVHIAGTNGKGSVAAMLSTALQHCGHRVGAYTSPHLVALRERIRVDGRCLEEADLVRELDALRPAIEAMEDPPSWFEVITAAAFARFARAEVDLAVVEAGMGGRFDATNVAQSRLSVLTSVAMDHTKFLGSTVEEIAWEKAGIAREGIPVVVGRGVPREAADVVRAECARRGAPLHAGGTGLSRLRGDWAGTRFVVSASPFAGELHLPLIGSFQEENLRVALDALEALGMQGWSIPPDAARAGLEAVRWPGRGELVRERPRVVLDCAHNPAGARALVDTVAELEPRRERRHLLFGVLSDKDVETIVGTFVSGFAHLTVTASRSDRALTPKALAERVAGAGARAESSSTVAQGLERALDGLEAEDVLVVSGSVTVVGEARRRLRGEPCDER
jgi:dihydrofolate synthase/folylpolyglutamate synthase